MVIARIAPVLDPPDRWPRLHGTGAGLPGRPRLPTLMSCFAARGSACIGCPSACRRRRPRFRLRSCTGGPSTSRRSSSWTSAPRFTIGSPSPGRRLTSRTSMPTKAGGVMRGGRTYGCVFTGGAADCVMTFAHLFAHRAGGGRSRLGTCRRPWCWSPGEREARRDDAGRSARRSRASPLPVIQDCSSPWLSELPPPPVSPTDGRGRGPALRGLRELRRGRPPAGRRIRPPSRSPRPIDASFGRSAGDPASARCVRCLRPVRSWTDAIGAVRGSERR